MNSYGFVDLDELVLLCRNEKARSFIQEAVQCYKSGANRQAIVATWIAVVYDIIHKLQELELAGDANASKILESYAKIRQVGDLKGSLDFERKILEIAKKDFELISEIEYIDLYRLQEDRNRCAHPAMNVDDEIYQPSPELARTHLRNAIEHLLQRPPVQGKAALNRLLRDVESEYFPATVEDAIKYLSVGPLARPRVSLIRNFVIVLLKVIMDSAEDFTKHGRYLAALKATLQLHHGSARASIAGKLNEIVMLIPDTELAGVLRFLIEIEDTWQYLADDSKERLKTFVRNMPEKYAAGGINHALKITDLHEEAVARIRSVGFNNLLVLFILNKDNPHPEIVSRAVELYLNSENYAEANSRGSQLIIPLANSLIQEQIEQIVRASVENSQIRDSFQRNAVLRHIRNREIIPVASYNDLLAKYGIGDIDPQDIPTAN